MTKTQIFIILENGVVVDVVSNQPIKFTVIDYDTDGIEEDRLTTIFDDDQAYVSSWEPTIDSKLVEKLNKKTK